MNFQKELNTSERSLILVKNLCKEIGVSFSTVNRWERGKSKPNYAAMKNQCFCNANSIKVDFDEDDT